MNSTSNGRECRNQEAAESSRERDVSDDDGCNECAICQEILKKPITLPCKHRFCSDCLDSWRGRYVFDKKKTCPQCRSKIPVTKSMMAQLESLRRLRADLESKINIRPCPLPAPPGTEIYNYTKGFYGNISDEEIFRIRDLPSDEEQQSCLRLRLEAAYSHFDGQIKELEEQIGDGTEVLEEYTDERQAWEDLPADVGSASENNDVDKVLNWLGNPPIPSKRINARNSKSNEMTLLHHATKGNRVHMVRLLLQYGADVDAIGAMGLSPFLAACTIKRYHSIALVFLQWGADKESTAPGPPGIDDITAIDIAQNFAGNEELADILKSPLGGRRCKIFGTEFNGKSCVVGEYFGVNDTYAVTVGEQRATEDDYIKIKSQHLKRCDRTLEDPGEVVEFLGRDSITTEIKWRTKLV